MMWSSLKQWWQEPDISAELRDMLRYMGIHDSLAHSQNMVLFLELLNYPHPIHGLNYSDVNLLPDSPTWHRPPLLYSCIDRGRPCMVAEVLKRGAKPNLRYVFHDGQVTYAAAAAMGNINKYWAVRLLVLAGANFDLISTYSLDKNKPIRELGAHPIAYFYESGVEFRRQYGPVQGLENPLPSQDFERLKQTMMRDYLAIIEAEVCHLSDLKNQADQAFKQNNYLKAAELYDQAGVYMQRFAGDHEELTLCYLEKALAYYQNAYLCYDKLLDSRRIAEYLRNKLTMIETLLTPNPAIKSVRDSLPPRTGVSINSNPEELKTLEGSKILQAIHSYRQQFQINYQHHLQLAQPLTALTPTLRRRLQDPVTSSSSEAIASGGDDDSSDSHDSLRDPLLKK